MIISWSGYGKGKTEAGFGCVLRQIANNKQILILQFLKDGKSSEVKYLETFPNVFVHTSKTNGFSTKDSIPDETIKANRDLLNIYKNFISDEANIDCIMLDEVLYAMDLGIFTIEDILPLIQLCKARDIELLLTGRIHQKKLRVRIAELSDIYSDVYCVTHHFNTKCTECNKDYEYYNNFCPQCGRRLTVSQPAKEGVDY